MLGLLVAVLTTPAAACVASSATPAKHVACADLDSLWLPEVTSMSAEPDTDGEAEGATGLPDFCRVKLTIRPHIGVEVWLPTTTYNHRFQAVGGGGFAGTITYGAMADALRDGYATSSTDTGHQVPDGSFALGPDGRLDNGLIEDFASRSLIEMTNKAKLLILAFYGQQANRSYWNGCSTGGRQGMMLAQRDPGAYDGILAAAPAINWDRFIPAEMWPQVVMRQELGGPIADCKLTAATNAAVARCDPYDGVTDGLIEDPRRCDFDATSLIGQSTPCGVFTAADAKVVNAIWNGPQTSSTRWYGLAKGAPLDALAGPQPFIVTEQYQRYWIEQNPQWDWKTLDYAGFDENFRASQKLFHDVIGTDDPNLSRFHAANGKLLMWHGWADQLIPPMGSVDYYDRVLRANDRAPDFARLFMAPGVYHCVGGPGPNTFDMFGALVQWVERGKAPDQIIASAANRTRPLCAYPKVARYKGTGDPNVAASFTCAR